MSSAVGSGRSIGQDRALAVVPYDAVVKSSPARRRWPIAVAAIVLAVAGGAALAYHTLAADDRGKLVSPPGAPYAYRVPAGFRIDQFTTSYFRGNPPGPDESVLDVHVFSLTAVNITYDRILVDADRDRPTVTAAQLLDEVRTQAGGGAGGFTVTRVANHDAVRYTDTGLRLRAGGAGTPTYLVDEIRYEIADGSTRVSVTCQWREGDRFTVRVSQACDQVAGTLSLTG
jgi:hypothetical protein